MASRELVKMESWLKIVGEITKWCPHINDVFSSDNSYSKTCNSQFSFVNGVGCLNLVRASPVEEAIMLCKNTYGGELIELHNYNQNQMFLLREFLNNNLGK